MERLDLGSSACYDGLEAAIHVGRYALVRELCRGKRVLDIACGQGYGSHLMKSWGAESVLGVDASQAAVDKANALFGDFDAGVEFRRARVEDLTAEALGAPFDLAVCIETVEHVSQPARLLRLLRASVKAGGAIVVTCPNDHWYYPAENESNPFHLRKYSLDEFRALAESEFGRGQWLLGTGILGFCSVPLTLLSVADDSTEQIAMMRSHVMATDVVPSPMQFAPSPASAAFFVGLWGAASDTCLAGAGFAVSMDRLAAAVGRSSASDEVERGRWIALQAEMRTLVEGAVPALVQASVERTGGPASGEDQAKLLAAALQKENRLLRDRVVGLTEREAAFAAASAAAERLAAGLSERVRVAEDQSSQWSASLNAERERLASAESKAEALRSELEANKLRLTLVERDRAALQLRVDELEIARLHQVVQVAEEARVTHVASEAPPTLVGETPPRFAYRLYRRVKSLVPAGVRRSVGPKIARWLPRP